MSISPHFDAIIQHRKAWKPCNCPRNKRLRSRKEWFMGLEAKMAMMRKEDKHVFTRDTNTSLRNQSCNLSGWKLSQESVCGMKVMVNSMNLCQLSIQNLCLSEQLWIFFLQCHTKHECYSHAGIMGNMFASY